MATQLQRLTAEISRASEFFSIKELQAQTGQAVENFATVIVKELLDNALDGCESAGVQPEIFFDWAGGDNGTLTLSVADNGAGISLKTIERIIDFSIRVSDKLLYRSPSRGAQGNALKTVIGMPFALGSDSPVVIDARGLKHIIRAWVDPLGAVMVDHQLENSNAAGTRVTVEIPSGRQSISPEYLAYNFAVFNPHTQARIRQFEKNDSENYLANFPDVNLLKSDESYQPTVNFPGEWRKFLPTDLTSPHWYSVDSLERLIYAHVAGGKDLTLREFIKQFRGLSPNAKAKSVCALFPKISRLSDVKEHPNVVADLLAAMKDTAQPPKPETLGYVGEEHFRQLLDHLYGVKRHWYKRLSLELEGIPYLVEVMVAETEKQGNVYHGVNFSPTFDDPIANAHIAGKEFNAYGLRGFLGRAHCDPYDYDCGTRTAAVFHLISPALEFLDRGKTRLKLPQAVADMIGTALWSVCKTIYAEEERRKKDAARQERRDQERERREREPNKLKYVVFQVLPEALEKATGGGQYPTSARSLYYQVRPLIQDYTNKGLNYNYFSQNLLVEYQQIYGPIESLYYDPRGVLYEPHTKRAVALGTREVESYNFPEWTFDKILFVEKRGLWPVLQAAQIAERYDMAVIASEGFATEAARTILERADRDGNYQLFVLHDADPAGYNIARTLAEETRRMPGYSVAVTDIGLKLEDALEMGLECEEFTRQNALPEMLALNEVERKYFTGRQAGKKAWICKRVELNAMSAPQLIGYIETKLVEAGATEKVLPPADVVEAEAEGDYNDELTRMVEDEIKCRLDISKLVKQVLESVEEADFSDMRDTLAEKLKLNPPESWRDLTKSESEKVALSVIDEINWDKFFTE